MTRRVMKILAPLSIWIHCLNSCVAEVDGLLFSSGIVVVQAHGARLAPHTFLFVLLILLMSDFFLPKTGFFLPNQPYRRPL